MGTKRPLKFLHEIGTVGVMGAAAAQLVLSYVGVDLPPDEHAALRKGIAVMTKWLLLPSLLVVLVSGLLAMGFHTGFHSAGWAWLKLITTPLVFETTLTAIDGPAQRAATLTARIAAGDPDAAAPLQEVLRHEQGGLWVAMFLFTANIVLAVWRPRAKRKKQRAEPAPSPE